MVYGRRGTGKTHVLRVLGSRLTEEDRQNTVVYIDARTLGSTKQFADEEQPIGQRCLALFQDILSELYNGLLEHIIGHPRASANRAFDAADEVIKVVLEPFKEYREEKITTDSSDKTQNNITREASLGGSIAESVRVEAKLGRSTLHDVEHEESQSKSYTVTTENKIIFPSLHSALSSALKLADTHLYILIDEWSSIPRDIQPYLAEFLKRGVLPLQQATLKIASLAYRSQFELKQHSSLVGFEVGADIAATQDLDDYYVFDRNPERITEAYADILLRHLSSELPDGYLVSNFNIKNGPQLIGGLFTERNTFKELARASEGVVRDLINIFTIAYFSAVRRGRDDIDRRAILEAARSWFEQDKERQLDERLHTVLRRIVDEVIGTRRARSFMLPREFERHPIIQTLFDARVLHQMQQGYADKDRPGVRYNIYTLDYGTYVDLLGTSKAPQLDMFEGSTDGVDLVVPFDDKRSIRRIVLNEEVLS